MDGSPTLHARSALRPEIQALRAVAVGAVVLHHGWPAVAPAGYMGVDVFFVVSGFLITGLLMREIERSGRVSLRDFYLRRARRILPAALVTLAVVSVLTMVLVPRREWRAWFREIVASALYYENWQLAIDSQIPRRAELESTPVQHFWSLSVEEQFYLFWPVLIVAALWIAARRATASPTVVLVVLSTVTIASFSHSVTLTVQDANLAYFSTFARTWEFGVGGVLAILVREPLAGRPALRSVVSWAGLLLIVVPVTVFRSPEAFPGFAVLLPVAGTLGMIWAGMPARAWSPATIARLRPVQWTGDASYSLYLWHWPIFMFAPYLPACRARRGSWRCSSASRSSWQAFRSGGSRIRSGRGRRGLRLRPVFLFSGLAGALAVIVVAGTVAPDFAPEHPGACHRE